MAPAVLLDFQTLSAKISKHSLDEAFMTLEEIQQTDSVLVGNLHPGTSPEMLSLYFESRDGNQMVVGVMMLSEGTAKVSFVDYDCKFCVVLLLLLSCLICLVTGFSLSVFLSLRYQSL